MLLHPLEAPAPSRASVVELHEALKVSVSAHLATPEDGQPDPLAMSFCPVVSASTFYVGSQLLGAARESGSRRAEAALLRAYDHVVTPHIDAVLLYLSLIVVKELRHAGSSLIKRMPSDTLARERVRTVMQVEESSPFWLHTMISGQNSLLARDFYVAVAEAYRLENWRTAYGGKKWAAIADVVVAWLDGRMSPVVVADRAWTLQHNTGSVFNKDMVFKSKNPRFVLDLQACGKLLSEPLGLKSALKSSRFGARTRHLLSTARDAGLDVGTHAKALDDA